MEILSSFFIYAFIIIATTLLIYGACAKKMSKRIRHFFLASAILLPSFFAGIRENIGTDFTQYSKIFTSILNNTSVLEFRLNEIEPGYMLLNKICILFNGNYHWVLFFSQLITIGFVIAFLWREKEYIHPAWGVFLYMTNYYQRSLNIVRQSIAIAICLYAFTFLCDGKKNKFIYIALVLLAASFHTSALLCILVPVLAEFYKNKELKVLHWISFGVVLLMILGRKYVGILVGIVLNSPNYYASYFIRDAASNSSWIMYMFKIFLLIYPIIFVYPKILKNRNYLFYTNLMMIGLVLGLFSKFTLTYVDRISYYFSYLIIIVIPFVFKIIGKKNYPIIVGSYTWITWLFWIYNYFIKGYSGTIPFQTIL